MIRLSQRMIAAVAVAGVLALPAALAAQERRLVAPVRGEANVEITKPNTKVVSGEVVTTILVKNVSDAPIAGLKVDENWYDKGGNPVGGDTYRHRTPLKPGTVIEVTLRTPRRPAMNSNQYQFSHANGTVKTTVVPKLEVTEPPL
ncbi:MAG: FxLYD domain-containing protein [Vicinamibacterales bacterium]